MTNQREYRAAAFIGLGILSLGLALFINSFGKLYWGEEPDAKASAFWIALFGMVTSFSLYLYKSIVGNELQSVVVLADARVSLCVGLISMAVFVALIVQNVFSW